jgi:hypothetical protein
MADILTSAITAAFPRRVLSFAVAFHLPKVWLTRLAEIQVLRPSGLPFACDQRMERRSLGFLLGFTPHRYQQRMPGAGTSVEHSLEANRRPFDPPFRLAHLHGATSRRTRISHTVEGATLIPRVASSPCTRLYPQLGFSLTRRRTEGAYEADGGRTSGPPGSAGARVTLIHQIAAPAQDGVRPHQQPQPAQHLTGQGREKGGEEGPVGGGEACPLAM